MKLACSVQTRHGKGVSSASRTKKERRKFKFLPDKVVKQGTMMHIMVTL